MKKKSSASLVFGLAAVAVGVCYLCRYLHIWDDFTVFFDGWWAALVALFCLVALIDGGMKPFPFIVLLAAVLYVVYRQVSVESRKFLLISAVLIVVGITLLLRSSLFRFRRIVDGETGVTHDLPIYSAFFCGRNEKAELRDPVGISVQAVFGSITVDATKLAPEGDFIIDVVCFCGKVSLILPPDINAAVTASPFLGSVICRHESAEKRVTARVSGNVTLGNLEVR